MSSIIPLELVQKRILVLRGITVMLDKDLADLYQVKPIALRQQVKRNKNRFPGDFMFQLSAKEAAVLVSQNVIPSKSRFGGFLPLVFTQEGVAMLSSVLNSPRAVAVNISIMRAFMKLRELSSTHRYLIQKINDLKGKFDSQFKVVFRAIRNLMSLPTPRKIPIGFRKV